MLYPENEKPTFRSIIPPSWQRIPCRALLGLNCKLEREELLRQLDVLKEMGMGGAHIHVRTGMATPPT